MLLFIDGMGHYDTPYIPRKWTSLSPQVTSAWTIEPTGREVNCIQKVTGNGASVESIGVAPLVSQTGPWTPTASGVFGGAFRVNELLLIADAGTSPIPYLFCVVSGSHKQFSVRLNQNGTFTVVRNDASPIELANSAEGVLSDTWFEFECKWKISHTVGSVEIRVNRLTILSISNVNTQANTAPLADWNSVALLGMPKFQSGAVDLIWRFCDVYLADQAGSGDAIRDFVGVFPINFIRPDGVGASSGWTPTPGPDNWQDVRDVPPDGDASYVSATAPATRDTYEFEDIPVGTIVLGAQQLILARKEDAGGATIVPVIRQGGVDFDLTSQGVPSEDYYYVIQPFDTNPATGVRFTYTEINAGQFGVVKDS